MTETKKHHTRTCMVFFVELRRGSSTLLCKAACGVPVSSGCRGQALCYAKPPAASPFSSGCRDLNLRRPTSSEKAVCAYQFPTLYFVQRGRWCRQFFSVFSEGKEISFLTWSSALPPVSRSADSLFLRLWLLPPSAPGSGRTQSPGNPSVAVLK